jgi:hypothetical protein
MTLKTVEVSIIVPKEATNLVTNPSLEIDATGYTLLQSAIARVTTQMRRGIAALQITPNTGVEAGVYYAIALTSGTQYSFSTDVLDIAGQTFRLYIADGANAVVSSIATWTGTGYWKRRSVTWTANASATFRLFVTRSAVASVTPFFVDGYQLEVGAVSTYLDGNMTGLLVGESAYRWNGTVNASTSWRSGQTRSGGTYLKLSTYAKILSIVGLGMAPISNIALPSSFGGAFYQNTVQNPRGFSIVLNATGGGDYSVIQAKKAALIDAVKPDKTVFRQPVLLQYDQLDANSLETSETLEIPALYESGLEMSGDGNSWNEKIALNFRMYLPLLRQQGEKGTALGYQTSVANANSILARTSSGIWQALTTGLNGNPYAMALAPDGSVYVGGAFTLAGGIANTAYIAKWNGSAWSALGTGMNASVSALAVAPDGTLYAGGSFTLAGGVAGTVNIAKWNGAAWSPLGGGTGGAVQAITIGLDGSVYAGGSFINLTDANGDRISKWNGAAWSSLGTGMDGNVSYLVTGPDGSVYATGSFTLAGGVAGTAKIAKWNGTTWIPVGTGIAQIGPMVFGPDGNLYMGGGPTGVWASKWNGTAWAALGTEVASSLGTLVFAPNGNLYAGGLWNAFAGYTGMAFWNGSVWSQLDVILPSPPAFPSVLTMLFDKAGNLYVGNDRAGSAISATVTLPNIGSSTTYPKVIFIGPGSLAQLKNYITGKSIFFNLTLLAGEVATLNLDPANLSFVSTFRGNILSTILPGSNLDFELLPGTNNISAYYYAGTTAASAIAMTWRDQYHSIDGAVR